MTTKPREFWIRPDEPFGGEHICSHPIPINEGYDFFQKDAVHVIEYSALVDAQAEIERLTNQYNEQLDLARHRAVELEQAKSDDAKTQLALEHVRGLLDEKTLELERIEALREGDLQFLNAAEHETEQLAQNFHNLQIDHDKLFIELEQAKKTIKQQNSDMYVGLANKARHERDELKLLAESYRAILAELLAWSEEYVNYDSNGKCIGSIERARVALSEQREKE